MGSCFARILFLFILLYCAFPLFSQTIKGVVRDTKTREPIPFANVYFSGTYNGTTANESGEFYLVLKEANPRPISATSVGYYSMTLYDYNRDSIVNILLDPKVYTIGEVIVKPDKMPRSAKEKMFRQVFLGKTYNATRCSIENIDDILLAYHEEDNSLVAYCDKLIIINNKALKYTINYFLDQFRCSDTSAFMSGTFYFREIKHSNTRTIEERRKNTYLGSRMHFIRALWENRLSEEGFQMRIADSCLVGYANLIVDSLAQEKFIGHDKNILISYRNYLLKSLLIFNKKRVAIEKSGYYDPYGLTWSGNMAAQRMADLLPYEYEVNEKK